MSDALFSVISFRNGPMSMYEFPTGGRGALRSPGLLTTMPVMTIFGHDASMKTSFAYIRPLLGAAVLACALSLAGCASAPPPTEDLAAARLSVARAGDADADQYAPMQIDQARRALEQAQAAAGNGRDAEARTLALSASALADLAHARARQAVTEAELAQRRAEITNLRQRLQGEG
ncbi:DUF4398 domain-containing protein [Luteimonas sp. TWI1437]|uniref:DUF4398 domain-containing protein n=1 Tax=unclassified Luteimonas TaxID=2629088 RepID=UPI00320935B5